MATAIREAMQVSSEKPTRPTSGQQPLPAARIARNPPESSEKQPERLRRRTPCKSGESDASVCSAASNSAAKGRRCKYCPARWRFGPTVVLNTLATIARMVAEDRVRRAPATRSRRVGSATPCSR